MLAKMRSKAMGGIGLSLPQSDAVACQSAKGCAMLASSCVVRCVDPYLRSAERLVVRLWPFANSSLFCAKMKLRPNGFWLTMKGVMDRFSGIERDDNKVLGHL